MTTAWIRTGDIIKRSATSLATAEMWGDRLHGVMRCLKRLTGTGDTPLLRTPGDSGFDFVELEELLGEGLRRPFTGCADPFTVPSTEESDLEASEPSAFTGIGFTTCVK